jgi:hypothetical protein
MGFNSVFKGLKSENLTAVPINGTKLPTSEKTHIEMHNILKAIKRNRKDLG